MKLIDSIKGLKGNPAEIPDCSRDDLPRLFLDMGYKSGAEVGVSRGEFSVKILKVGLKLYCVDPWQSYDDYEETQEQKQLDYSYELTKKRLTPYPNCTIIRKTSMEAAKDFEDRSLDFVYIDGNHQFKYVAEDIAVWSQKVKVGGIISGHDYLYTIPTGQGGIVHVKEVVNAYTHAYGIQNWYVLGRRETIPGEARDKYRSWMWVNKELEYRKK